MSLTQTRWFRAVWPRPEARSAVLMEYQAMARFKLALADIAARGGLRRPAHHPGDPYQTAWNDGRRSLAQEIIDMTGLDQATLQKLISLKQERTDHD